MFNLFKFKGGLHLDDHKEISTQLPILDLRLNFPQELILPLLQHAGLSAIPIVNVGDDVKAGQLIAISDELFSSSIHAPTSGKIIDIRKNDIPHPSGLQDDCIILMPDGLHQWDHSCNQPFDYQNKSKQETINFIQSMGIVGLGGAVFPTHLKINKPIQTLIINGAECEPYITCDDMLMQEFADKIIKGIQVLNDLLDQPKHIIIAIEDNKSLAIQAIQKAIQFSDCYIQLVVVPTKYPSGSAKQLIKILTNIEIPHGKRSSDFGIQCFNVATALSIAQAIFSKIPMISRIVTFTGEFNQPRNVHVLLGTPIIHILHQLNLLNTQLDMTKQQFIMGGPMMGVKLKSADLPIVKASNCILIQEKKLPQAEMPCIRCGLCAEVCPAELQPMDLYWFSRAKNFAKAEHYHIFDCIECGCCDYVCPSEIPLVNYYRFAKSEISAESLKKQSTNEARDRHEFRKFRLERDQQERSQRLAEKAKEKVNSAENDAKKAEIAAALARVKAKKLSQQNTETSEKS